MRANTPVTFLTLVAIAASVAGAQSFTPDSVDVQIVDRELVGIRNGAPATREWLRPGEQVAWHGARGTVGGVLTDKRFLAVSPSSSGWREVELSPRRDGLDPRVALGANLALCITRGRVLAFPAIAGEIFVAALRPGEIPLENRVNEHVGAVVTAKRVLGFSSGRTGAAEISLRVRETIESMRVLATSITVRTPERLLIYRQSSGTWSIEET